MQTLSTRVLTAVTLLVGILIASGCTAQMRKSRYAQQGERYFKAGQYDEAKIEYLKLLRIDPRDAVAYTRIGQMWLEEGSGIRAGGYFMAAKKLNPGDIANRVRLARTYSLIGQVAEARKEAVAVLQQAPDSGEALLILAETSRTPEEHRATEEQLQRFPQQQDVHLQLATGTLALRKSDLPAAETAFGKAVTANPKSPQAHVGLALVSLAKKNAARAGEEFKAAADLSPPRSAERLQYAQFKMQTGAGEEAKAYLKSLTTQARDFTGAWTLQARIALGEKKYDEAASLLDNVFTRDPDDLEARLVKAQVLLAKREPKKAIEVLDRLDKSFAGSPIIKYQLALAHVQNGNSTQAIADLEPIGGPDSNYVDAILLLAELNIRTGKPQAAVDPLISLLKKRPDLSRAQVLLAGAYQAAGRSADALAVIRQQIDSAPQNPASYLLLGAILGRQSKIDEARQAFEKVLELDKNNPQAMDQLVSLDLASKNYASARQRVDRMLSENPNLAFGYYLQGKIASAERKTTEAEVSLKKAIELDPNLGAAFSLLVNTYVTSNKLPQALQQLELVYAKNPQDARPLILSGLIHEKQNDFAKARDDYKNALAINPNSVVPLNNLAYIYAEKLNDLGRASELARKAHDLVPAEASVSDTLGWILYKQGDYQHAAELLEEGATKLADDPEAQFHLGMARYMMGQLEPARSPLEKAVAAAGDFPWKEEAKRRLAVLAGDSSTSANLPASDLEKMTGEQSNDPIMLVRLGAAWEKRGAADKAADAYQRALQANPRFSEAALKLAQIYAGPLKNNAKALEYARKARDLAPTDPHVTGAIGHVAYQAGNFTWAYSLLQEAARQLPDDAMIAHDLAWAAYSLGNIAQAEQAMQRVVVIPGPTNQQQDAKRFLAMTQLDSDDTDPSPSESQVNTVLAADPNYLPGLMARADIQLSRGEARSAAIAYTGILQKLPDFAPAQKRLAGIYSEDPANVDKGYELATKARRALPNDPTLAKTLGALSFQRREYARALQLLQEADGKKPLEGKSLFYLGMAHLQLGHKTEGKQVLDRALTAGLPEGLAAQAKAKLTEVEKASPSR